MHRTACDTAIKATQSKSSEIGAEREKHNQKVESVFKMCPLIFEDKDSDT